MPRSLTRQFYRLSVQSRSIYELLGGKRISSDVHLRFVFCEILTRAYEIVRARRRGIDLVDDDVQKELRKEAEIIQGVQSLLKRTLEQADEQTRLNRKARYNLEKDMKDKLRAFELDKQCVEMKSGSSNVPAAKAASVKIDPK